MDQQTKENIYQLILDILPAVLDENKNQIKVSKFGFMSKRINLLKIKEQKIS